MKCENCNGTGVYCSPDDLGDGSLATCSACTECNGTGKIK